MTWASFNACVKAGKCRAGDDTSCSASGYSYPGYAKSSFDQKSDAQPATCVGEEQAEQFCNSVGGKLPTLDEWFVAARGAAPRRFSWGDTPTSCDQHPFAGQLLTHLTSLDVSNMDGCMQPDSNAGVPASDLEVGRHPSGASPSGIEDVLLTPGELLRASRDGMFRACDVAGSHCIIFGTDPGAIDGVEAFYKVASSKGDVKSLASHPYGFRCVVDASEISP